MPQDSRPSPLPDEPPRDPRPRTGGRLSFPGPFARLIRNGLVAFLSLELSLRAFGAVYGVAQIELARRAIPVREDAVRILCIGESTTFGAGADDYQTDGYPAQLEVLLSERYPGVAFQVFNRGVPAVTSLELARHVRSNLAVTRPHVVILQTGHNPYGPTRFFDLGDGPGRQSIARLLNASAALGTLKLTAELALDALSLNIAIQNRSWDVYWTIRSNRVQRPIGVRLHIEVIDEMIRACREEGRTVVALGYFFSHANAFLSLVARHNDIPFCRISDIFVSHTARGERHLVVSEDRWHPSSLGYRLIAERLADDLRTPLRDLLGARERADRPGAGPATATAP
jgi:lysophospholipase L1-like esterase